MITAQSHTKEWLFAKHSEIKKRDPQLIEKVIKALTLLEHLKLEGLDCVFKGGTSQFLILSDCHRFSIDIDLILPIKPQDLHRVFDRVVARSVFLNWEPDKRQQESQVPKEHFKFFYTSHAAPKGHGNYVLLDLLYEVPTHTQFAERPIKSKFTHHDGDDVVVKVPTAAALLGDKLTAFAPTTIGIQYGKEKELEIIKQLFDISHLMDYNPDLTFVKSTFEATSIRESEYRRLQSVDPKTVLGDARTAALTIVTGGQYDPQNGWTELDSGIKKLANYVIDEPFHQEIAISCAAKVFCLTQILNAEPLGGVPPFPGAASLGDAEILDKQFSRLNRLRRSNPEAFFFLRHGFNHRALGNY